MQGMANNKMDSDEDLPFPLFPPSDDLHDEARDASLDIPSSTNDVFDESLLQELLLADFKEEHQSMEGTCEKEPEKMMQRLEPPINDMVITIPPPSVAGATRADGSSTSFTVASRITEASTLSSGSSSRQMDGTRPAVVTSDVLEHQRVVCFGWIKHFGTKKWRDKVNELAGDREGFPSWNDSIAEEVQTYLQQQEGITEFFVNAVVKEENNGTKKRKTSIMHAQNNSNMNREESMEHSFSDAWRLATYNEFKEKTKQRFRDERKAKARGQNQNISSSDPLPEYGDSPPSIQESLEKIRRCRHIDEFIKMYEVGGLVHDCLQRISRNSRGKDPEMWAMEWAQKLLVGDEEANNLDRDRKLSLELLYTLCNQWKGIRGDVTISEDQLVNDFKTTRILEILRLCLVMDRAKMLYFMTGVGKAHPGMHWVAERHVEQFPEWQNIMKDYQGEPSINKRYLWLLDLERLGLGRYTNLRRWTTPVMAPSMTEPQMDATSQF